MTVFIEILKAAPNKKTSVIAFPFTLKFVYYSSCTFGNVFKHKNWPLVPVLVGPVLLRP